MRQNSADQQRLRYCAQQAREASLTVKRFRRQLQQVAKDNSVIAAQASAVGVATACVLWAELGDPDDYHCGAAYRKAMGLAPRSIELTPAQ